MVFRTKWAVVLLCLAPGLALGANLGTIAGTVREYSGAPVASAKVKLARGEQVVAERTTGPDGRFEFLQVPFGQYRLLAAAPDGRTESQDVRLSAGEVVEAEVFVPAALGEVVVKVPQPKAPEPTRTATSSSIVEREDIKELPRGDSASVNEILSTQPGFVQDAFGNLYARGNHANIGYEIDGVPLPDSVSGLFGGFLSPKFIDNMDILTGGLGAEYGNRLAAVVNLNTRRPSEKGEGELELRYGSFSTYSGTGLYGRRFGKLSFILGGSANVSDRALDPQAISPILHDSGNEERVFGRVDYDVTDRDHVLVLLNFAHNFYQIPLDPTTCSLSTPGCVRAPDRFGNPPPPFFPFDTASTENERDLLALATYRHDFEGDAALHASVYYRRSYGFLFGDAPHALGPTQDPASFDPSSGTTVAVMTSDVKRVADHAGGTAEYVTRVGKAHVLKLGGKVDQLFASDDFTSYTRSDALQGPDPALTVQGSDRSHATSGGVYVTDRATFGKLVVDAGLRYDFQYISFAGGTGSTTQTGLGPRVGLAYSFTPSTVGHVFAGLLWMPPPVLDTPAAARILGVVPATQPVPYDLKPEQDRYAEIGLESRVAPWVTLKGTVWGKLSKDQLDDIEVGSTNLVSPYNFEEGRALGAELGVVTVLSSWFKAFGSIAWEKAQGRNIATATYLFSPDDLANHGWQILDHSQTWTANAGATVRDGATTLSALMNYGSGLRTGPNNNETVPDHWRFDATLAHQFLTAPLRPTLALDVINLFDAHYAYRISNGFNGSHWAPERSVYLRLGMTF
jgi:outer membrane cobalamin receptor